MTHSMYAPTNSDWNASQDCLRRPAAVANMAQRPDIASRELISICRWRLWSHAGTRIRAHIGAIGHHRQHDLTSHRMADSHVGHLCVLHEPSSENLRQAHDIHFCKHSTCSRVNMGKKVRTFKPILVRPDSISREPLQTRTAASWEAESSARLEWHHMKCLSKQQSQTSTLSTSEEPASQYGTSSCLLESLALASSVATSSRTSGTNG